MGTNDRTDQARELAYFRFSLIAPIIRGTFSDVSAKAYCRRVTEKPIVRPDGTAFRYEHNTLEKWVGLYRNGGMEALMPKTRSDKGSVRVLSEDCIREIIRIKEKYPKLDAVQIHIRLVADGFIGADVSVRTVQRFIKANGLKTNTPSNAVKDRKAYEEEFFGGMWTADTCCFPYVTEGGVSRRTYLIAIIDDCSRLIVGARLFYGDTAYNFQKVLKAAVAAYGIPNKLYVDHGPSYQNSQLAFICGSIGTVLIHAPVRDGAAKGKIERFFGTLKSRFVYGLDMSVITSLSVFNEELTEHIRKHNLLVNSSTGQTPMDRFLETRSRIKQPGSADWLDECFMNRVKRRVRNDSTLSIQNRQFDAPMQFMRRTAEIRFLPDRLGEAYIFEGGVHYPLRLTDKIANGRMRRDKGPTIDYSLAGGAGGDTEHV